MEVDEARLGAVAGGQEAILGHRFAPGLGDDVALNCLLDEALHQGDERGHVLKARLGVGDADLDRAEPRLEPGVPPKEGRLGDGAGADQEVDALGPVLVRREVRGQSGAREGAEE